MPCFWTDLVKAKEDCEEGGGGDNHVDALIFLGQQYDSAPVGDWVWDGAPLYAPGVPDAPIAGSWQKGFGPGAAISTVVNTIVSGGELLDNADFSLNASTGRLSTVGELTIPVVDSIGGIGPYSASGFFMDPVDFTLDPVGMYGALPSQYRYPSWVDECIAIPRRRENTRSRSQVNLDLSFGGSVSDLYVYTLPGDLAYDGAGTSNVTATSAEVEHSSPGVGPWGDYTEANISVSLSIQPSGLGPVDVDGYIAPQVFVTEPGLMDAYVSDIEFFAMDDPGDNATHDWPAAGTGEAVPGFRFPVSYHEDSGIWHIGQIGSMLENPEPPSLPSGEGGYVGTLRSAADDSEICRVAVLIFSGGS